MITCPNKNLQEWKDLVSQVGEARAGLLWVMVDGDTSKLDEVNYDLKSVNILQSDKAKQIFEKGKKNNWDLNKILTELAIPKEQKELILDSGKTKLDDIVTDLLANFSYTVEINTAKQQLPIDDQTRYYQDGNKYYSEDPYDGKQEITFEEYERYRPKLTSNSSYYSNLTVPGGTNYTENEIATPAITPSIKGHAQFATDQGIGWFRSDDKHPFTGFLEDLIASGTIKKVPCE